MVLTFHKSGHRLSKRNEMKTMINHTERETQRENVFKVSEEGLFVASHNLFRSLKET